MFTKEDIIGGMDGLGLETQVEVLESTLQEVGIADFADVLAMCLMSIMLDLQDADVAPELVGRIEALKLALRRYNEVRFAAPASPAT